MRTLRTIWSRIRLLWQRREAKREIDDELRFHLEQRMAENIAAGMTPEDAAREARKRFGNWQSVREECRESRGASFGEATWQDAGFGLRMLRKNPGFAAVAVLTLALGIGANTALFSIINTVLLRALPYDQPNQVVQVWEDPGGTGSGRNSVSGGVYADWKKLATSFQQLCALWQVEENLTGADRPERLAGAQVSAGFFDLLGVHPEFGRTFLPNEDQPGSEGVVVLSHALWKSRFAGTPRLVGRTIELNGKSYEVIGVLPASFRFPRREAQYWIPFAWGAEDWQRSRYEHRLQVFGRLRPGITIEQARAEMKVVADAIRPQMPERKKGWGATVIPLHESVVGSVRPPLLMLMGTAGLVLLVACGNVANLMLVRGAARQREFAVRMALGAGRRRLIRQLMTESLVLAGAGGALGLYVAWWGTHLLVRLGPQDLPRIQDAAMDGRVLVFSLFVTAGTALLCGLAPALGLSKVNLNATFKGGGRIESGSSARRFAEGLVALEVALAVMLLVGAGLFLGSFRRLISVNPGFDPTQVLTLQLSLPDRKYPAAEQRREFLRHAVERIEALPGAVSAGFCTSLPLETAQNVTVNLSGRPRSEFFLADYDFASADYFKAMSIPLRRGRFFPAKESSGPIQPVIVNETFVRRALPGTDPVGKHITRGFGSEFEIVGVVGDVHERSLAREPVPHVYHPIDSTDWHDFNLFVRTQSDPGSLAAAVRQAVLAVDRDQPVANLRTMREVLGTSISYENLLMRLCTGFALAALLLAILGVYGVVSFRVSGRTREMGIRLALGARRGSVVALVLRQGMATVLVGIVAGLAGALMLSRLLRGLLYEIGPNDPATILSVTLLLAGAALLACCVPARRAARIDPMEALRCE